MEMLDTYSLFFVTMTRVHTFKKHMLKYLVLASVFFTMVDMFDFIVVGMVRL